MFPAVHVYGWESSSIGGDNIGAGGRSELNASTATFQLPSACFLQIATYFPLSSTGEPLGPVIVTT